MKGSLIFVGAVLLMGCAQEPKTFAEQYPHLDAKCAPTYAVAKAVMEKRQAGATLDDFLYAASQNESVNTRETLEKMGRLAVTFTISEDANTQTQSIERFADHWYQACMSDTM